MRTSVAAHPFRLACVLASLFILLPTVLAQPAMPPVVRPPEETDMLTKMSGGSSEVVAGLLGVTQIAGKPVASGPPGFANAPRLKDVALGADPTKDHNEPTVAANPRDRKNLVAGSHYSGAPSPNNPTGQTNRCVAYRSSDNGATWSAPALMSHLSFPASTATIRRLQSCSDPVIRYAPDGSRVYYTYMDIKQVIDFANMPAFFDQVTDADIVLSYSDDNGVTWSPPVVALDGDPYTARFSPCAPPGTYCGALTEPGYAFDKNWVGVHVDASQANWVYVTATRFNTPGFPQIAFTRSANKGNSFSAHTTLDGTSAAVVQGSHSAGGIGGEVVVAWYHSGTDGFLTGKFQIRTRRSGDHGATFDAVVTAATDGAELPFWLGPYTQHKRWWGGMFPSLGIDSAGRAHVAYTHDPVANTTCTLPVPGGGSTVVQMCSPNTEDGDIRYINSNGPPYMAWSLPATVNDDGSGRAQGYPGLAVERNGSVHVVWEDTRLAANTPVTPTQAFACLFTAAGACESSNGYYDLFYGQMLPRGLWLPNLRVSEVSSRQDFTFTGDYTEVAANDTTVFAIWSDRRHTTDVKYSRDNVFGSRIIAGGSTTTK